MGAQDRFAQALRLHQAGDLHGAELLYREVLARDPNHADACNNLGLIAQDVGQHSAAWQLVQRAIALDPRNAGYLFNAARVLTSLDRPAEAIEYCRRALALRPDYDDALCAM